MNFKVFLLCCLLTAAHSRHLDVKLPSLGSRIIGGHDAFPGQFPHQVSLQVKVDVIEGHNGSHFCGGTILNERWILTAVHCVTGYESIPMPPAFLTLIVKGGKHNLGIHESSEQVAVVEKYFKHKLYNEELETSPYDVALLKLKTPLKLNERVAKAVLPKQNSEPDGQVLLSGWGAINEDHVNNPIDPTILQTVTIPIVDRKSCNEALKIIAAEEGEILDEDAVHETNICTGPLTGGISPCAGDSGGPLVATNDKGETEIVGVVSWGMSRCGRKGGPAIYVRVSSFIDWIQDIIKNN